MKVIDKTSKNITIYGKDIPVGTIFTGKIQGESVFLKTYSAVVDLKCPNNDWTLSVTCNPKIENYCVVNATLTIE